MAILATYLLSDLDNVVGEIALKDVDASSVKTSESSKLT